jgi:hypothetical protein
VSAETAELVQICEALSAEKRRALAEFARFLLSRGEDEAWDRLLDDPRKRPRLEAFIRESAADEDEPLDQFRL